MTPITHPVALADQEEAAAEELTHLMAHAAKTQRMHVSVRNSAAWLNERFIQCMTQTEECEHLSGGPRPTFTALWRPGLLVCRDCLSQLDDEDRACDRCGTDADTLAITGIQLDSLALLYALCADCADADQAASTPAE